MKRGDVWIASGAPLFRVPVEPNNENGLNAACRLMADKITTIPKSKLGRRIGRLADDDLGRLGQAMLLFLGLAAEPKVGWITWAQDEADQP